MRFGRYLKNCRVNEAKICRVSNIMIYYRKGQLPILFTNLIALIVFGTSFISKRNYEFIIYVAVIIFFILLIILTNKKVYYPNPVLWGLTLWAVMHMAGGSLYIGDKKLYELMIFRLSENYPIFRYDQLVHIIGFGTATLTMFYVLKPLLRPDLNRWTALSIIVFTSGLGVGAFNEILEFITALVVPETGVGGYVNTSLDLVADATGALAALVILRLTQGNKPPKT
jgi:uncharacterized membrane protein YjdF